MFRQVSHKLLLLCFFVSALLPLTGCSMYGDLTEKDLVAPSLPSNSSINSLENKGTTVSIEQFEPKAKATDVLVELTIDTSLMKKLILKYGSDPLKLDLEKTFLLTELESTPENNLTRVKALIKDAGTITPLYVSSAIESEDGVKSAFSEPKLVSGVVE